MFCKQVVVIVPSDSSGRPVTSTSTRSPGSTNPATPATSDTRTDTARMPTGMIGASPSPLPRTASRAFLHRFIHQDRIHHWAVDNFFDLGKRAFGKKFN